MAFIWFKFIRRPTTTTTSHTRATPNPEPHTAHSAKIYYSSLLLVPGLDVRLRNCVRRARQLEHVDDVLDHAGGEHAVLVEKGGAGGQGGGRHVLEDVKEDVGELSADTAVSEEGVVRVEEAYKEELIREDEQSDELEKRVPIPFLRSCGRLGALVASPLVTDFCPGNSPAAPRHTRVSPSSRSPPRSCGAPQALTNSSSASSGSRCPRRTATERSSSQ